MGRGPPHLLRHALDADDGVPTARHGDRGGASPDGAGGQEGGAGGQVGHCSMAMAGRQASKTEVSQRENMQRPVEWWDGLMALTEGRSQSGQGEEKQAGAHGWMKEGLVDG